MSPFVKYTLARLALFAASFAVLYLLTFWWLDLGRGTPWFIAFVALAVSAIASVVVLRRLREDVVGRIEGRAEALRQRLEESRSAEDLD